MWYICVSVFSIFRIGVYFILQHFWSSVNLLWSFAYADASFFMGSDPYFFDMVLKIQIRCATIKIEVKKLRAKGRTDALRLTIL